MSDTTPQPQPPDGWVTDYGPGAPQPPYDDRPRAGRRGAKVLVLTVVMALLVGGGAFAFFAIDPFHLFRPGPQPAEALPANAVFYAGLDLDPKASQKVDALRFLNHFPAFHDHAGLTDANADIADAVVGKAIDDLHCDGVTYAQDVKPWLGERFGVAVMPPTAGSDVPVVFAVQVSDDEAARRGITALNGCDQATGESPTGGAVGMAFVNGYLLLAETQAEADAYASSADAHSLADNADFKADTGSLGDLGVATVWVDVAGAIDGYADAIPDGTDLSGLSSAAGRVAATFRFASDHIEIATSLHGDPTPVDMDPNPVVKLPDTTMFAMSESGGDQRVAAGWDRQIAQLRETVPTIDDEIAEFESTTGLRLPADLETLMGHNLLVAFDKQGFTSDVLRGDDASALNFGARFTNDPAKLNTLYSKVIAWLEVRLHTNVTWSKKSSDDGIAIASNPGYAGKLSALDGDLGDSDAFTSVVDDGASKEFVLFFDFDAIEGPLLQEMRDSGASQDAIDIVKPLRAFGMTSDVDGDYEQLTLRLSVDD